MKIYKLLLIAVLFFIPCFGYCQSDEESVSNTVPDIDYLTPKRYEIAEVNVIGGDNLDHNVILLLTGLTVGQTITVPGDKLSDAIDKLWKQGLFEDVQIAVKKVENKQIYLDLILTTRPRLSKFRFDGISKSDADKIREKINIMSGEVVTQNMIATSKEKILNFYDEKGYSNAEVNIREERDTSRTNNELILIFTINKGKKVKIKDILVEGNTALSDSKVRSTLKSTKRVTWWRFWKASKYVEPEFRKDLDLLIEKYNEAGYRDAKVEFDTVYMVSENREIVKIQIYEGNKYYFRDISWVGNTKYSSAELTRRLRIDQGTPYNKKLLEEHLQYSQNGTDINSLYMDDGYLFFNANPVEVLVQNDSIDIEVRIREGKQARINKIDVSGNTRTNDYVIMRELKTLPGELFSREKVIRAVRDLAALNYFNQETINPNVKPNAENGTVDITYEVEEVSTDQLELSGGWGGGRIIGTVGVTFNNFSAKNFFKKSAWTPLPSGDGQRLSFRAQTNGISYYSISASFTEPWLGGRKPNSLTVSAYYSYQNSGFWSSSPANDYYLGILGASVSLGKRLKWPDDYFTFIQGISFQQYRAKNYGQFYDEGYANNLNYNITIGRNSLDAPIYPRTGSDLSIYFQLTPPYSLFSNKDYSTMPDSEKYKWLEYYKINFKAAWYFNIVDNLVFTTRIRMGFLSYYNENVGVPPFERYFLGGDGLSGWAIDGREVVPMRGYGSSALSPKDPHGNSIGASVYDKFTFELRYPVILSPQATIFALGFAEAGNSWLQAAEFNPFRPYAAAGLGIRVYMPYFGMLGFDWGYGFDRAPGANSISGSQMHFSINQSID